MKTMMQIHRELWDDTREKVRNYKKENITVSQRKIAVKFGVSLGYVNKCLKNLEV